MRRCRTSLRLPVASAARLSRSAGVTAAGGRTRATDPPGYRRLGRRMSVTETGAPVAILGSGAAQRFFPGVDPLGQVLDLGGRPVTVVGTFQERVLRYQPEDPNIFAPYTVYFELDSSVIRSDEGPKLENIAQYFATNKTDVLMVEGHCDERGTEQYNMALGDRRALAVREYLIKLGVENTRIRTVSYGESRPVDPRHNEAAWKKNRRGFSLLYKAVGEPQK